MRIVRVLNVMFRASAAVVQTRISTVMRQTTVTQTNVAVFGYPNGMMTSTVSKEASTWLWNVRLLHGAVCCCNEHSRNDSRNHRAAADDRQDIFPHLNTTI